MSDDLKNIVEAVLLAAESPLSVARIQTLFDKATRPEADEIKACIEQLQKDCENRGVELKKINTGYRYQTREKYADYLRSLHAVKPPRLSRALLETLSIIAYRQPVTRGDIEEVRGVAVSPEILQRLIEREWVKQVGVRDVPGRPALFGTSAEFLSYFNLESLKDLPSLMEQRDLGEIASEMETPLPAEVLAALEGRDEDTEESEAELKCEPDGSSRSGDSIADLAEDAEHAEPAEPGANTKSGVLVQPEQENPEVEESGQEQQLSGQDDPSRDDAERDHGTATGDESEDKEDEDDERPASSVQSDEAPEEPRHDGATPVQELAASAQSSLEARGELEQSAAAAEINRVA